MLSSPTGYDDLVFGYDLNLLKKSGDWSLDETGGLATSKCGDFKLGSTAYDAMYRLVEGWRLNAPTMRMLFDANNELRSREDELEDSISEALVRGRDRRHPTDPFDFADYHKAQDASGSAELGRWVLAGSLMIAAASLLGSFRSNTEATDSEWKTTPQMYGNVSIGQAIISAANIFRHRDEYVKARVAGKIERRQQNNTSNLMSALSLVEEHDLYGEQSPCERLAFLIGGGDFSQFERAVLQFANAVAEKVEARS